MNRLHSCHQGTHIPMRKTDHFPRIQQVKTCGRGIWKRTDILVSQGTCDGRTGTNQLKDDERGSPKWGKRLSPRPSLPADRSSFIIILVFVFIQVLYVLQMTSNSDPPASAVLCCGTGFWHLTHSHISFFKNSLISGASGPSLDSTPFMSLLWVPATKEFRPPLSLPRTTEMTSLMGFLALHDLY